MQPTRQHILNLLNAHGPSTVDALARLLSAHGKALTPVTVRHHLKWLMQHHYVASQAVRRRATRGRPQVVFALTSQAREHLPSNYVTVTEVLLHQMQATLPDASVNVIIEGLADTLAEQSGVAALPWAQRREAVVQFLTQQGYQAWWEADEDGWVLHTSNCPYHNVAAHNDLLCRMDMRLIAQMLGVVPRRMSRIAQGDQTCAYWVPQRDAREDIAT